MAKDLSTDKLEEIRKRYKLCQSAWDKQYKIIQEDIKFCSTENQWPEEVKAMRQGRPTYAADRLNAQVRQLTNAQRDNRPAVTVHACNNEADRETAEVLQGIIRHIEYESCADLAYDESFEWCVRGGLGFWRILTDYEKNSFNQKIVIDSINNPFQVYIDPTFKKIDGSDINYAFICEVMTEESFKQQYPDADLANSNSSMWRNYNARLPDWFGSGGKECIVMEYFTREYVDETICKMVDGSVKNKKDISPDDEIYIILERNTQKPTIKWYKLNGIEILEETEWLGEYIPIIPVFGNAIWEDDKRIYNGLIHNSKEEQMMLNVIKTTAIELIAQAPKTPWVGPVGFMGNRKADWQDINVKNFAAIEYEIQDDLGNTLAPPTRNIAEPPLIGIMNIMQTIENDIKATNDMYDPAMGNKMSNHQSGVAIRNLQTQGSVGNFHFSDNLSRAIRLEGKILLDLIPKIYSEERVIRIIGIDETHKTVGINGAISDGNELDANGVERIYDVTTGLYDVTVSSGPSYQTKRAENLAMLLDLAGKDQQLMSLAGDLIVGQIDSPIAGELQERLQLALPPQLRPQGEEGKADPQQLMQQVQSQRQLIQKLTQTLQQETALADKVQQSEQTKLQIAQMDNQTAVLKHQTQLQHDSNVELLRAETAQLKLKSEQAHDLIAAVHAHMLKTPAININMIDQPQSI